MYWSRDVIAKIIELNVAAVLGPRDIDRRTVARVLSGCAGGPGSASRVVVEPVLQVARFSEIDQVFRQLLQLPQRQIN